MPTQSSPTSVTTASSHQDRSERARGRWKILRKALLKQPNGEENTASIHRFLGYRMLPASIVEYKQQPLHDKLRIIHSANDLELSLRAFIALAPPHPLLELHVPSLAASELHAPTTHTGSKLVAFDAKKKIAYVRLPQEANPLYCIKSYRIPSEDENDADFLWIHEKRSRSVSSLHDLVRHRKTGIDNTGDVCVWDAALTLAWALAQKQQQDSVMTDATTILELGAGMAAMAGLSLLKTSPSASRLIITDGQASAVANNRVHCRCMGLESKVDCRVLVWSTKIEEPSLQADCTLIADCTHFTDFHAGLLWTAVYHTAVGGSIWMCQPERTKTWDQFLSLVEYVNRDDPLVTLQEKYFSELMQMHETFSTNDASYNPNLHRPRIFVLTKVRQEMEMDCQKAISHVQERDTK